MGLFSSKDDEAKDLRHKIKKIESELEKEEERHAREERQLREELRTVQKDAQDKAAEIDYLRQELQTVKKNAERDRRRMEQDLQSARDEASHKEWLVAKEHGDTVRSLNDKIQRVRSAAEVKEWHVAQEHTHAIDKLNKTHKQTVKHLQREVTELNEAWLNRDDEIYQAMLFTRSGLPSKPDDKIKDQVLELQDMIEDLSEAEWKPSPETWTDCILQRVGAQQHGQRSLKSAIIQDLIWSLLYQRIFCSPFRMFGEEGENLEREWNEHCGKGEKLLGYELYTWPSPSVKTERWRYMTIKESREILSTPVSSLDQRARVKRGFKTSQDGLVAALKDELERVVQLTEQEIQVVEKLAKKAAVTWLDFAMHHCRIVIRPTGPTTKAPAEKLSTIQRGSVALMLQPNVGRYGNVNGVALDSFTTIKGCEGKTLDVT